MTGGGPKSRLWRRRLLFSAVAVAGLYLLVELVSLAAFASATGESFSFGLARREIADDEVASSAGAGRGVGARDPTMAVHPYLGYVYTPEANANEAFRQRTGGISEHGFLDSASPIRKRAPNKVLVGIIGGSVAAIFSLSGTGVLADELAKRDEFRGKEIEFVRLAIAGHRQPQGLIAVNWLLARGGELDVLINLDGFNEIAVGPAINEPHGVSPWYPMNWGLVAAGGLDPEQQRHLGALVYLRGRRRELASWLADSIWSWSVTSTLLWKLRDNALAHEAATHAAALPEVDGEPAWYLRGPATTHGSETELIGQSVAVWRRCSEQLAVVCAANRVRYLHLLQPNQYVVGSKPLTDAEREKAIDEGGDYQRIAVAGYPMLRTAGVELRAAGVEFHDLTDAFAGVTETLYVDVCCHFNKRGNDILARRIARILAGG